MAKWKLMKVTSVVSAKAYRGAAGKVAVFGLLKRSKVYTAIIPNAKTQTLLPNEERVDPDMCIAIMPWTYLAFITNESTTVKTDTITSME